MNNIYKEIGHVLYWDYYFSRDFLREYMIGLGIALQVEGATFCKLVVKLDILKNFLI